MDVIAILLSVYVVAFKVKESKYLISLFKAFLIFLINFIFTVVSNSLKNGEIDWFKLETGILIFASVSGIYFMLCCLFIFFKRYIEGDS